MYVVLVVTSFLHSAMGQMLEKGQCVEKPDHVVVDLDIPAFMGTWYQIARIPNTWETGNCSVMTLKLVDQPSATILVVNKELNNRRVYERYGNITFKDGKFHSTYDGLKPDSYWVVGVNYDHFTMLFGCENIDNTSKHVWAWMLSRTREMSTVVEDGFLNAVVATADLKGVAWSWTEQDEKCDGYKMIE